MKHLKEIILERRDLKKYIPFINDLFKEIISQRAGSELDENKTIVFEENNQITISFRIWGYVKKEFIIYCMNKFDNVDYEITGKNEYQITIEFYGVSKSILENIEAEKKYNL